ncbi:MAG: hypothetical protein UZ07_CHB004001407 [Chlorobi bacterium OLB7]|nr:MAG: hypothetical protein UZ07_CHB004001407 [Chlorobi bacterium OLB7]
MEGSAPQHQQQRFAAQNKRLGMEDRATDWIPSNHRRVLNGPGQRLVPA